MRATYTQEQIDEARRIARNEALVECAEIARRYTKHGNIGLEYANGYYSAAKFIEQDIQALIKHKDDVAVLQSPESKDNKIFGKVRG